MATKPRPRRKPIKPTMKAKNNLYKKLATAVKETKPKK